MDRPLIKKINENLYIVLVDSRENIVNVGKKKPYRHSKYFPVNQDKATQVDHKSDTNLKPNSETEDFSIMYRPISPSAALSETNRAQLQHEIDISTGTEQIVVPEPGNPQDSQGNSHHNTSPVSGINNREGDPTSSSGAILYERLSVNNPRTPRNRKPVERLQYPHDVDHVEVNKKWKNK